MAALPYTSWAIYTLDFRYGAGSLGDRMGALTMFVLCHLVGFLSRVRASCYSAPYQGPVLTFAAYDGADGFPPLNRPPEGKLLLVE